MPTEWTPVSRSRNVEVKVIVCSMSVLQSSLQTLSDEGFELKTWTDNGHLATIVLERPTISLRALQ